MFNTKTFRDYLKIPTPIWMELEPSIKEKLNEAREKAKLKLDLKNKSNNHQNNPIGHKNHNSQSPKPDKLPSQYPNVKPKNTLANLVSSLGDMDIQSDSDNDNGNETDDDMLYSHGYMVRRVVPVDPPSDIIEVKAHFEYMDNSLYNDRIYAISDGGADSCILGQNAKVISYTGRYANLVGYDPATTRTEKVPIVTALIKVKSSVEGQIPVLLQVHEAPYNSSSPITLLSEYQIREYGLVIDSVAKKHFIAPNVKGQQKFQVNQYVHINFEDRGGLMGFELLPIEPEDEDIYDIITITSPEKWTPHKYQKKNNDIQSYDPSDNMLQNESMDYLAFLNHTALAKDNDSGELLNLNVLDINVPLIDTQIYATTTWHRTNYQTIDPKILKPYLGYRPIDVIKKTLKLTTQTAKMCIKYPMKRHVKSRYPHMNATRIDETVSTDPMFSNCRSIYHGYIAAQIFYGCKSHTIYVYGIKRKGEFPKIYKDFIREHGAPSALRRDNAREEQSEEVKEINKEFIIKDQFTEPYHPQQNPVESCAIRYLKSQISILLDITGAPDSLWYMAAKYVAEIQNICSDAKLPMEIIPLQYQTGSTPDTSAYLQFTFWQPVLYLDHESEWPASKERSGRWVGIAHGIGDLLTFWILDDQSKNILAQSVVRPFKNNL